MEDLHSLDLHLGFSPSGRGNLIGDLDLGNSLDTEDNAEATVRTNLGRYVIWSVIPYRNYVGDFEQVSWPLFSRLSRIAFRARDSSPSTDLGERPIT